mmetsp:Transcript_81062/g.262517  ORF Transcript_81062/g.262517 Transcript_81062/m.262517 type:complete len:543 (+) Transcript_81062:90-1718(+)
MSLVLVGWWGRVNTSADCCPGARVAVDVDEYDDDNDVKEEEEYEEELCSRPEEEEADEEEEGLVQGPGHGAGPTSSKRPFAGRSSTDSNDDDSDQGASSSDGSCTPGDDAGPHEDLGRGTSLNDESGDEELMPRLWPCDVVMTVVSVWFMAFRLLADSGMVQSRQHPGQAACVCIYIAHLPWYFSNAWVTFQLADVPTWFAIGLFCSYGLAACWKWAMEVDTDFEWRYGEAIALTGFCFAARGRRTLWISTIVFVALVNTSLFWYVRYASRLIKHDPTWAAATRVVPPCFEVVCRHALLAIWKGFGGRAPQIVFTLMLVVFVVISELLSLANFFILLIQGSPWRAVVLASISSVATDFVNRSKILPAARSHLICGRRYKIKFASDVALKARWAAAYLLWPFAGTLAAWELFGIQLPCNTWLILIVYFTTELISDLLVLLWQWALRRHQGRKQSLLSTLGEVQGPFGHIVPLWAAGTVGATAAPGGGRIAKAHTSYKRIDTGTGEDEASSFLTFSPAFWWKVSVASNTTKWTYVILAQALLPE